MSTQSIPPRQYVTALSKRAPIILSIAAIYATIVGFVDPGYSTFPVSVFVSMAFFFGIPVFFLSRILNNDQTNEIVYSHLFLLSLIGFIVTLVGAFLSLVL